jgi:hypothetical protein
MELVDLSIVKQFNFKFVETYLRHVKSTLLLKCNLFCVLTDYGTQYLLLAQLTAQV